MPAPSFRAKLLLAMLLVVTLITGSTVVVLQQHVESTYRHIFAERFQDELDLFAAGQEARLATVRAKGLELARSVRLIAAMEEEDAALLYRIALDELRDVLRPPPDAPRARPAAFFRFVSSHGEVLPTSDERAGLLDSPDRARWERQLARAGRASSEPEVQQIGYLAPTVGRAPHLHEVILTQIIDPVRHEGLGALAVGFAADDIDGRALETPPPVKSGVWLDGRLYTRAIPAAVAPALASAVTAPGAARGELALAVDGIPQRLFFRVLAPESRLPAAYQVGLYSMAESLARQRALRRQVLASGAAGLGLALVLSLLLARGLSVSIRELVAAAGRVGRGKLDVRVPVRGADEVGRLTSSFSDPRARRLDRLAPMIVVPAVVAAFLPALGNQFVGWDDDMMVTGNPRFRGLSAAHLRWMFTTVHGGHYQPLSWVSLALDHRMWGMDPFGYHLTSVLLHAANALLFYFVIRALLRASGGGAHPGVAALAGALFFGLHPLRVESVAWVTARRDVLSALFLLTSVLSYLRMVEAEGRRAFAWLALSLVSFACSLLAKAWGVPLPVVLLLLDAYPLRRLARIPVRVGLEKLAYGAIAAASAVTAVGVLPEMAAARTLAQHGVMERVAQAAYGLVFYLWKTVLPVGLSPLYLLPPALDPHELRFVACVLLVLVVMAVLSVIRHPAVLVAWLAYGALLLPLLGVLQVGPQLVADRYTYLACMPWAVLLAAALARVAPSRSLPATALVAVVLGVLTARQARVWHDADALWEQALRVDPGSWVAYTNRAVMRERRGDGRGALEDYTAALRFHAGYPLAWANRGTLRQELGDLPGALDDLTMATRLSPHDWRAWNNRGWARQTIGDFPGAIADYQEALRVAPADLPGRGQIAQNLAAVQARAGVRP